MLHAPVQVSISGIEIGLSISAIGFKHLYLHMELGWWCSWNLLFMLGCKNCMSCSCRVCKNAKAYEFAPTGDDRAAENARLTKMKMIQNMLETHTIGSKATKGPNFIKKGSKSMAQKQLESFKGFSGANSALPAILPPPSSQISHLPPLLPNPSANQAASSSIQPQVSVEMLSSMHQLASLMNNPLFKQMLTNPGTTSPLQANNGGEGSSNSKMVKKLGKMDIKEADDISSEDQSMACKEKIEELSPPSSKKRKSGKSRALKIKG